MPARGVVILVVPNDDMDLDAIFCPHCGRGESCHSSIASRLTRQKDIYLRTNVFTCVGTYYMIYESKYSSGVW